MPKKIVKKEKLVSNEEFEKVFNELTISEKEKIIRNNLPGLMKMVKNEEEAIKEIISVTTKPEWKKMMINDKLL